MLKKIQEPTGNVDYKKYKGIVFGFPEEENVDFSIEFARFLKIGDEIENMVDQELEVLRKAVTHTSETKYHSYLGDVDEVFEFYLGSTHLNEKLSAQGLTYQYGETDSWSEGEEEASSEHASWSDEVKALLEYIGGAYLICSEKFLNDEGYCHMYEKFNEGYEDILQESETEGLDFEEEYKRVDALRKKIESEFQK